MSARGKGGGACLTPPPRSITRGVLSRARRELCHDFAQVERTGLGPRRKLLEALEPLGEDGGSGCEHEGVLDAPVVVALTSPVREFEWIGAQVEQLREAQHDQRVLPDVESLRPLLQENQLPVVVAK